MTVLHTGLTGKGSRAASLYQEWIGHKGQGCWSSQDFTSAMAPTPHRSALSWIHGAEHTQHMCCMLQRPAEHPHSLAGSSCRSYVNDTACMLPTWALGPAVLTPDSSTSVQASLGSILRSHFMALQLSAKSEQCKIYTDSHLLQVQGKIYMYLH